MRVNSTNSALNMDTDATPLPGDALLDELAESVKGVLAADRKRLRRRFKRYKSDVRRRPAADFRRRGEILLASMKQSAAIKARRGEHRSADQGGYQMPLYPWPVVLMLLYVACGLASGFAGDPFAACGGIGILIAGVLAYEGFRRRGR